MNDKVIQIGGKFYKQMEVVMLPTEREVTRLFIHENILCFNSKDSIAEFTDVMYQHLYILSSEEIKEGDWIYNNIFKQIEQVTKVSELHYIKNICSKTNKSSSAIPYVNCKKIIATTDDLETHRTFDRDNRYDHFLPRPSDDFIKAYVKAQGKGFDKVLVEYEGFLGCTECSREHPFPMAKECFQSKNCKGGSFLKLKTAPDNTITIKPVQEEKTSWNRKEVIEMIKCFSVALQERKSGHVYDFRDKWIKENL